MAENGTAKLKLVHLVYGLLAAAVVVGIALGRMGKTVEDNVDDIKLKVSQEIFVSHEKYQTQQFRAIQKTMDDGFGKLEKSIEKLAK